MGNEDKTHKNEWVWDNGVKFQFPKSYWDHGEPNNLGTEHCLRVKRQGNAYKFRSSRCDLNWGYVVCGPVGGWLEASGILGVGCVCGGRGGGVQSG